MVLLAVPRTRAILLLVLAILFSQLALAGYLCPTGRTAGTNAMMAMTGGEPCEGMALDEEQPVLCHQHCYGAPQADIVKMPVVSLPAIVHVMVMPLAREDFEVNGATEEVTPHPPPEPVFLSTLRLRV